MSVYEDLNVPVQRIITFKKSGTKWQKVLPDRFRRSYPKTSFNCASVATKHFS